MEGEASVDDLLAAYSQIEKMRREQWDSILASYEDVYKRQALNDCQSTDLRKLEFQRNASFASVNLSLIHISFFPGGFDCLT